MASLNFIRTAANFTVKPNNKNVTLFHLRNLTTAQQASNASKRLINILSRLAVIKEITKEVYVKEGLRPPSGSQISAAWEKLKNTKWQNLSLHDYKIIGVRSLECLGFFAIGEIIGRRSLIGYKV
ncbi:88_t:CDS:2 [Diversispora eburnea]|uniref:88_t:CDS:1 n=1 Tax=Diversispora eburnea TaxID=1213867 RepID=A0A9N8VWJ1_9GLOM|nr:88_t:CDS:2 [Diversispora eburnea]